MSKLSCLIFLFAFSSVHPLFAQSADQAAEAIGRANQNIKNWFNHGEIDSVLTLYREDACVFPSTIGKKDIGKMLTSSFDSGYRLKTSSTLSLSVSDSIAVEKYAMVIENSGKEFKQKGMTEWRFTNGKWLIVNDITVDEK